MQINHDRHGASLRTVYREVQQAYRGWDKELPQRGMGFGRRKRKKNWELLSQASTRGCDKVERKTVSKQTSAGVIEALRLIRLVRARLQSCLVFKNLYFPL